MPSRPSRVAIMGVVNATPDSFSDGGRAHTLEAATALGALHLSHGADILDIGGESTRPGATAVSADEEQARVIPVIAALCGPRPISIDTYKAVVADAALRAGASIVNDVSGGLLDPALLGVVARHGATVILGHLRGTPQTMIEEASYADVVAEVRDELGARVHAAREAGIPSDKIWIDPGLGFSKRAEHSALVLAHLDRYTALGARIVVGASRKSFLSSIAGQPLSIEAREAPTSVAHALAIWLGATVVRVHDVALQLPAIRAAEALRAART